jgi:hypothetical protein
VNRRNELKFTLDHDSIPSRIEMQRFNQRIREFDVGISGIFSIRIYFLATIGNPPNPYRFNVFPSKRRQNGYESR